MPTLVDVEGFEHQITTSNATTTMNPKLWDTVATPTLSFVSGRTTGGTALRVDENATNAGRLLRNLTTAGTMMVASFYVKLIDTPSGVTSRVFHWTADGVGQIQINTSGQIIAAWATGTSNTPATGPTITDGLWHLVDVRVNSSPATHTIEWTVDGVAQSNATSGLVAASNIVSWAAGTSLTTGAATFDIDDIVISVTSGDYAIGPHTVYAKLPAADVNYTNVGTNIMERADTGNDISASDPAWSILDEWPPPQGAINGTTVTSSASGASNYVEVSFTARPSWATSTAWGVTGVVAHWSDTTGANTGISRIVAGATTTDIFSGDMSETSKHYTRRLITAPAGGWTTTNLDAATGRVGFGTLQPGAPEWLALMLQVATADVAVGHVVFTVTPTLPAAKVNLNLTHIVLTTTPSLPAASVSEAAPGTSITHIVFETTPTLPAAQVNQALTHIVLTATPTFPVAAVNAEHSLTHIVLEATPSLPTAHVKHSLTHIVLTTTPALPAAQVNLRITHIVLTTTPTLPAASVNPVLHTVLEVTPTLPAAQVNYRITHIVLTSSPSLPAASVTHGLTHVVLTVTPSLPAATILPKHIVTHVALEATPSLPAATVTEGAAATGAQGGLIFLFGGAAVGGAVDVTHSVLTVTPSLPAAAVTNSLTHIVLTTTPSLPTASVTQGLTHIVLTVAPSLPAAAVIGGHIVGHVVLEITPSLPTALVQANQTVTHVVLTLTILTPSAEIQRPYVVPMKGKFQRQGKIARPALKSRY